MSRVLTGIVIVLAALFVWMNWPFPIKSASAETSVENPAPQAVETTVPEVPIPGLPLDEQGNLLYLMAEWESVRVDPNTATGIVKVPANRVVWGDHLTFYDCEGNFQDLVGPAIMALTCESDVTVIWGAYALDERVTLELAKEFLDRQYQSKSGFPDSGFAIFPSIEGTVSAP